MNPIQERLTKKFSPDHLEVIDESHRHRGHAGNTGGGHFKVLIVSGCFEGRALIDRHRMVHEALGDLFRSEIHALSLKTLTPGEWGG